MKMSRTASGRNSKPRRSNTSKRQKTAQPRTIELQSQYSVDFSPDEYAKIIAMAQDAGLSIRDYLLALHDAATVCTREPEEEKLSTSKLKLLHETNLGKIYHGDSRTLMKSEIEAGSVDLIMTSPPYALVYKKDYGNEDADRYLDWFRTFVAGFDKVLKPNASLVIDIGGVWKKGDPIRSLYHFELLIMLCREYGYHLCQEFYWWNPAKLPAPAEWVNVRRVRVKDAVNCIWWLSRTPYPRASNRRVLQPYSPDMNRLLKNGYRHKQRPSGHNISSKFKKNNRGSIPPNLLALANNDSNGAYRRYCQENDLVEHPAQFPRGIPAFFIRMLTDSSDFIFDPFAGSCVTGEVAESMGRRWMCCELRQDYAEAGIGRFIGVDLRPKVAKAIRTNPYEVYAPRLDLIAEKDAPIPKDGGSKPRRRRRSRGK